MLGGNATRYTEYRSVSTFPLSIVRGSPVVLNPSFWFTSAGDRKNRPTFALFPFQCGFCRVPSCPPPTERKRPRDLSGRPKTASNPPGDRFPASKPPTFFFATLAQNSSSSPPHPQNCVANPFMDRTKALLATNAPEQYCVVRDGKARWEMRVWTGVERPRSDRSGNPPGKRKRVHVVKHHVIHLGFREEERGVERPAAVRRARVRLFTAAYMRSGTPSVQVRSHVRRENVQLIPPVAVRHQHSQHLLLPCHTTVRVRVPRGPRRG